MAIRTTRWSPDTCGCVVEYSWDDTVAADQRAHTTTRVAPCAAHPNAQQHVGADPFSAATVWGDENIGRKSRLEARLLAAFPALGYSFVDPVTGLTVIGLKPGSYAWFFDAQRVLNVSLPSLSAAQKQAAQTWCDNNIGAGKVLVS